MTRNRFFAMCAMLMLAPGTVVVDAQGSRQPRQSLAIKTLAGRDNFERYCAPCHGSDGRGRGSTAKNLTSRPADLTGLTRANRGTFPRDRIVAFVRGEHDGAARSEDMPRWGAIFMGLDPSDPRTTQRIVNVVAYIESLQVTSTAKHDPGARGAATPKRTR